MIHRRFVLVAALCALSCGGPSEPAEEPGARRAKPPVGKAVDPSSLESALIAKVPGGTYGPYIGRTEAGSLVVWAATQGERRKWLARLLAVDGTPKGDARPIADAPSELGLVAVKPGAGGTFVVASTRPEGERTSVEALVIGRDARPLAAPIALDTSTTPARWIDAVATKDGALVLWARQQKDAAELFAVEVTPQGKRGEPKRVLAGARAWQAIGGNGGVTIAAVTADGVSTVRVAASGQVAGETTVSGSHGAALDLDAARLGDRTVLAWSDRSDFDAELQIAVVDDSGKLVVAPKRAIDAVSGDQALVRVVPPLGGGPAYLVWEIVGERASGVRSLQIASVTSEGVIGAARGEVLIAADDGTTPELAASARGIAALTLARSCARSATREQCEQSERLPTYVELDRQFSPLASEPMRLAALSGGPAELAWGLGCTAAGCTALAAVASDPAPVYAVKLASRTKHWRAAGGRLEPRSPPRPSAVSTLAVVEPLADVAAARVDKATLAAWVTYFDPSVPYKRPTKPAPDGKMEPTRALLQVRAIPDGGAPTAAETISLRARSLGGVALAAGPADQREAMLAWTALDAGQPQVFTTVISADGKKLRQKMLTTAKGEKTDVAIAAVADGYVVAWVDERHGDAEIYLAKLNRYQQRVGNDRRLTNAAGAATGVALLALGDQVLVAWADARDAAQPGSADPYVAFVKASDTSPVGSEQRLATTRAHSFSPLLTRLGATTVIAWIEADGGGVQIGQLDAQGRLARPASTLRIDGTASGLALSCDAERCRGVAAVDRAERGELVTLDWAPGAATSTARRLAGLPGPAGQAVAPALFGDELVYSDQVGDRGRVRRMSIQWR